MKKILNIVILFLVITINVNAETSMKTHLFDFTGWNNDYPEVTKKQVTVSGYPSSVSHMSHRSTGDLYEDNNGNRYVTIEYEAEDGQTDDHALRVYRLDSDYKVTSIIYSITNDNNFNNHPSSYYLLNANGGYEGMVRGYSNWDDRGFYIKDNDGVTKYGKTDAAYSGWFSNAWEASDGSIYGYTGYGPHDISSNMSGMNGPGVYKLNSSDTTATKKYFDGNEFDMSYKGFLRNKGWMIYREYDSHYRRYGKTYMYNIESGSTASLRSQVPSNSSYNVRGFGDYIIVLYSGNSANDEYELRFYDENRNLQYTKTFTNTASLSVNTNRDSSYLIVRKLDTSSNYRYFVFNLDLEFVGYSTSSIYLDYGNFDNRGSYFDIYDLSGNSNPELISLTDPIDDLITNDSFTVSGAIKDINVGDTLTVKAKIDGITNNITTITADGNNQNFSGVFNTDSIADGYKTLEVWIEDNYGGKSTSQTINILIDKSEPNIPTINMSEIWSNSNVTFTLSDNGDNGDSGIDKLEYKIDTGSWQNYTNQVTARSVTGESTVYARSIDNAGNISLEQTKVARVDKLEPTHKNINITGHDHVADNTYYIKEGKTLTLDITAEDIHSNLDKIYLKLLSNQDVSYYDFNDNFSTITTSEYFEISKDVIVDNVEPEKTLAFNVKGLKNSAASDIILNLLDNAQNQTGDYDSGYNIQVDGNKPLDFTVSADINSDSKITLHTGIIDDLESGVPTNKFRYNNDIWESSTSKEISNLIPNTTYTFEVEGRDNVGNIRKKTISETTYAAIPTNIEGTKDETAESKQITVSWNNNQNPVGTVYELEVSEDGVSEWTNIYTGVDTSYTQTNLGTEVTKYYRVRAKNIDDVYTEYSNITEGETLGKVNIINSSFDSKGTSSSKTRIYFEWEPVLGATDYKIIIFDGNTYRSNNIGNVTSWDSDIANIFPSEEDINVWDGLTNPFRWDGSGEAFSSSLNDLYVESGGSENYKDDSYRTWIHIVAVDSEDRPAGWTWNGATYVGEDDLYDNDAPNIPSIEVTNKTIDTISLKASTTDKYMTNDYPGVGLPPDAYRFGSVTLNLVSDWLTDTHTFSSLRPNKIYKFYVKARDLNMNQSAFSESIEVSTLAKDPKSINIIEKNIDLNYLMFEIINDEDNVNTPETKIIVTNLSDNNDIIVSDFSSKANRVIKNLKMFTNYKVESVTRNLDGKENEKILWKENVYMYDNDLPPTIHEFELNYSDKATQKDQIDIKLVATDDYTETKDLKVQFQMNNEKYGYDKDENIWKKDFWGDYQNYYPEFNLLDYGEKTIYVLVKDEKENINKSLDYITYSSELTITPEVEIEQKETNEAKTGEELTIYSDKGYILTNTRLVRLEISSKNSVEAQYSLDGVKWSPWEKIVNGYIDKKVTLDNKLGELKSVYTRSKNSYGQISETKVTYYLLDQKAPDINVKATNNVNIAIDGRISLRLEMKDNVSEKIDYKIIARKKDEADIVMKGNNSGNKVVTEILTGLNKGFYNVEVVTNDELGNQSSDRLSIWSK